MDEFMQGIFLNANYHAYAGTDIHAYEVGSTIDITNQLQEAVQGYVDLNDIGLAVATSITIDSLPSCGTLLR